MWAHKSEIGTVVTVPDDLQLIAGVLRIISSGGGVVATGHMNWRDVGWGVGVRVLVEGVVSGRGAVWRMMSCCLHIDSAGREDNCVADDCLGIRATGSRAAGLVGQVSLYHENQTPKVNMKIAVTHI